MTREQIRSSLNAHQALVCTLLGEAAGESINGQVAVANTIRNRADHPRWWGRDVKSVCLAKAQFSCWWENNTNSERVYALAAALLERKDATGGNSLVSQLSWIASGVLDEMLLDNTRSSDHYLTRALYQSDKCPSWARGKTPQIVIDAHVFLRLEI